MSTGMVSCIFEDDRRAGEHWASCRPGIRPRGSLYEILQGFWDGPWEGAPAQSNTGALVRVNPDGTFTILKDGLNQPTSLEILGNTAYVVSLAGEVWTIETSTVRPCKDWHEQ